MHQDAVPAPSGLRRIHYYEVPIPDPECESRPFFATFVEQMFKVFSCNFADLIGVPDGHVVVLCDLGRWKRVGGAKCQ